jgi:hypothetical protein
MNLKKLLLFFLLLLPLTAGAARPHRSVSSSDVSSIISEFRHCEGVEVIRLGRMGTALARGVFHYADDGDEDMQELGRVLRGIKGMAIMDYEDASGEVRERIERRLTRALSGRELLIEAKDGGDIMQIFGRLDEATGTVRDFVMHVPGDGALICLFGSIPMEAVSKISVR